MGSQEKPFEDVHGKVQKLEKFLEFKNGRVIVKSSGNPKDPPPYGQNPVGLRLCNGNWYTYSLLCYKYTEKKSFLKKKIKKQHFL